MRIVSGAKETRLKWTGMDTRRGSPIATREPVPSPGRVGKHLRYDPADVIACSVSSSKAIRKHTARMEAYVVRGACIDPAKARHRRVFSLGDRARDAESPQQG